MQLAMHYLQRKCDNDVLHTAYMQRTVHYLQHRCITHRVNGANYELLTTYIQIRNDAAKNALLTT